jgi:NAD+ kinase
MKVGFHALSLHKIQGHVVAEIASVFQEKGFEIWFSSSLLKPLDKSITLSFPFSVFSLEDDISSFSLLLSLGGDGTILDSLLYAVPHQVPMLGVNFGRMGFLPNIISSNLVEVASILQKGQPEVIKRSLLEIELSDDNPFRSHNFALNEVSITKKDTASMITIQTFLNGEFLNEFWGDGLIVSTPTGSTGYSLSCGGPILWPQSKGLVLTPVSPHNLSMRPIVLPDDVGLRLLPKGRQNKIMISMDSRSRSVTINQAISIKTSAKVALFLNVPGSSFSQILREKLFWGKDLRN